MFRSIVFGLAILFFGAVDANAETISMKSLLHEMTAREALARLPNPPYTCRQFSSYDRDSVGPDKPGWFANWDRSQFIRVEQNEGREEHVLMDTDGPGALVRFWATWHGPRGGPFTNGTLRVYLDGNASPAIEGPIADLIDRGALTVPPLSQGVSPETRYEHRGHNLYLPIPYAQHCKITYETTAPIDRGAKKGEALYYQINYRTYPRGTAVQSFSMDQLKEVKTHVAATQERLTRSGADEAELNVLDFGGPVAAGESRVVTIEGPAAVRELKISLQAEDQAQALRSTVLQIDFDDEPTVWCPVGALFGIGYQFRPHRTWYTDVAEDGNMACYWVMPFAKSCRLTVHNLGKQTVNLTSGEARHGAWDWDDRSMHFHATWRQLTKVDTGGGKDMTGGGAFDVNYVKATGQGVYVGDTLTVFNGTDAWWGEGDEKIFVDGESFPSHIGTGTEDYYGYAWCKPAFFEAPFHAQPCGDGNLTVGFTANSRYRALDAIPFTMGIQMDMELWHWRGTRVNYAPATFWHARPGASCNVEPDPETASAPVALRREDVVEVFRVEGAIEGETLKILRTDGGTTEIQAGPDFRWSDDHQLWWRDGKVGDSLMLEFPVTKDGRYRLVANVTKAVDYGIVKVGINDNEPKQFDRYHASVAHDKLELGTFELKQGANRLTIEIAGANEKAVKRYMFGLDYLHLTPAP